MSRRASSVFEAISATMLLALSACSSARAPDLYVLGDGPPDQAHIVEVLDKPVVRVERVQLPDYLDSTEMVTRQDGAKIETSTTGQWVDRLSIVITREVAQSLAAQEPQVVVSTSAPVKTPSLLLTIHIDEFEGEPAGCVFSGRWSIVGKDGKELDDQEFLITTPMNDRRDAAVAAAMTRDLDQLTIRIAAVLRNLVAL